MKIQEFANMLNGRQYREEITKQEEQQAKELGYVVVFGYSDDNTEFRGAIYDEVGCYDGGTAYLDKNGIIEACGDECRHYQKAIENAFEIEAIFCNGKHGFDWEYETEIPHATFEIYDEDEKYCRGIVFDIKELAGGAK